MPAEDRDRLFENALARHLRADAGTSDAACLDPELLAAYHERLLSPEEMNIAKEHLVSCSRCQEILAQLEATEHVQALQNSEMDLAVPAMTSSNAMAVVEEAVSPSVELPAPRKVPEKVATFPARKNSLLRWAAPAGAIAAVLLLWIGLREFRRAPEMNAKSTQIADNRDEVGPRSQNQAAAAPAARSTEKRATEEQATKEREQIARESRADDQKSLDLPQRSLKHPPLNEPVVQSATPSPAGSFQAGAGNGLAPKSKPAEQSPAAAPTLDAANSAKDAAGLGGITSGAMMAKKTAAPAPAPSEAKKAKTKSLQDRDNLAYSAGRPDTAADANASPVAAPPPPAPAKARASTLASGQLRGTVTDPSGAVVSGANVALKSANGSTVTQTSTDNTGTYTFDGVTAGNYQLELQSPGFKTDTINALNVASGDNVQNAQLQVGNSAETVEVTAQATALNTQSAEVSAHPRKGRNVQALLPLSAGLQTVNSPDGKAVWKFGDLGQIVYSKNAGKDWTLQSSGVSAKLLAASAPSAKICWIAGAVGTLLRTADGGKHWRVVATPISGDLSGVRATDGEHAFIWDLPNHVSYETSDGGATWKQSSPE